MIEAGRTEIMEGAFISPRIIKTRLGEVEIDITAGEGPVLMGSHGEGGLGNVAFTVPNSCRVPSFALVPRCSGTEFMEGGETNEFNEQSHYN